VTERELQAAILEMAAALGWLCIHHRPARTDKGWRTAAEGNGAKGFPDVVMVRHGHLLLAELKDAKGTPTPEQRQWLDELLAVSIAANRVQVYTWRPANWANGDIESVLRFTGAKEQAA
jgi:hypothetical protein